MHRGQRRMNTAVRQVVGDLQRHHCCFHIALLEAWSASDRSSRVSATSVYNVGFIISMEVGE